jgi:hypothetical protein
MHILPLCGLKNKVFHKNKFKRFQSINFRISFVFVRVTLVLGFFQNRLYQNQIMITCNMGGSLINFLKQN